MMRWHLWRAGPGRAWHLAWLCGALTACGGSGDDVATPVAAAGEPCAAIAPAASVPASGASAPASATGAYLCAAGVGVADLDRSVAFYKGVFGMTERARVSRADRSEVVLDSADRRGSQLVLYTYTDGSPRDYQRNPGKVVFYVNDTAAAVARVVAAGGAASPPAAYAGRQISFARDPDGTLVEIASDTAAVASYVSAFGVGVADLEAAKAFYVDTLDMRVLAKLSVSKSAGVPWYDEYILAAHAGRGSSIVLMHYTDGSAKHYTDNPVKLVLRVTDPVAYVQRIAAAGKPVLRPPEPEPALGGTVVGQAQDADGTLLEILTASN